MDENVETRTIEVNVADLLWVLSEYALMAVVLDKDPPSNPVAERIAASLPFDIHLPAEAQPSFTLLALMETVGI